MTKSNPPLIIYPCLFTLKIMGVNQPQLLNEVVAIIDSLCESFNANQDIKSKLSSKENYLAITATVLAQSKQHLDSVYLALNQHPLVKVTL